MAKDQTRRLKPDVLTSDEAAFAALKGIAGYTPVNPEDTIVSIEADFEAVRVARAKEAQAVAALAAMRDEAAEAEWRAHNRMMAVKDQVRARYGKDSNEAQALGLKKPSEYKRPARKAKSSPAK